MARGGRRSPEAIEKIRAAAIAQFANPAVRRRISEEGKVRWADPVYRQRMIDSAKRKPKMSQEQRDKISAKHRGMKRPPETGQRIAAAARKRWASYTPERRHEICMVGVDAANRAYPTSIEIAVRDVLTALGIRFEVQRKTGPYFADIYVPKRRLVIECDGEYWHGLPGAAEKQVIRDAFLKKHGYRVVHLGEREIRADALAALTSKIDILN